MEQRWKARAEEWRYVMNTSDPPSNNSKEASGLPEFRELIGQVMVVNVYDAMN